MRSALSVFLAAAMAGCAVGGVPVEAGFNATTGAQREAAATQLGADEIGAYLELMRKLVEGGREAEAAFADAADAAARAPTAANQLKLALARALPGHAGSDAVAAERALSGLIAGGALGPDERALAAIHRAELAERLVLDASAKRLAADLAAARAARDGDDTVVLAAALAENRRLRAELDEATRKLEAITSIERSIRESQNEPEPP